MTSSRQSRAELPGKGWGGRCRRGLAGVLPRDWSASSLFPCAVRRHNIQARGWGRRALGGSGCAAAAGRVGAAAAKAEAVAVAVVEYRQHLNRDRAPQGPLEGPMETPAGGCCGSGPPLLLSEGEQQCYSELFARCAGAVSGAPGPGPPEAARVASGSATAAAGPVADLFRASQLPAETLHQVSSWSPCLGGPVGTVCVEILGRLGCPRDTTKSQRGGSAARDGGDALVPQGHQPPLQLSSSPSAGCAPVFLL